jgi:hypothetical protein
LWIAGIPIEKAAPLGLRPYNGRNSVAPLFCRTAMPRDSDTLKGVSTTVQIVSVVVGVVLSVWTFNTARVKEAEARKLEAAKPFLTLRQELYREALKVAGVLANPELHSADEMKAARKRFRELYVAELSMVETKEVATHMAELADVIDPDLRNFTDAQKAAYRLSQELRKSFAASWQLGE